jgi:hypothetical protein
MQLEIEKIAGWIWERTRDYGGNFQDLTDRPLSRLFTKSTVGPCFLLTCAKWHRFLQTRIITCSFMSKRMKIKSLGSD